LTVVELDPTGSKVLFAARIGSNGLENTEPAGLAVDAAGNMYVAGNTNGPDLVTTPGAFQTKSGDGPCCGLGNGFVAKIAQPPGPQITAGSVFNAATLQSGGIAPNEFITIKGIGLGPATGVVSNLTALLATSAVYVNGTQAYLAYSQDGQINALAPFGIAGTQSATIQCEFNGVKGNTVTVPVVDTSPGIFTLAYGPGQAVMVNQDGSFNSSSNPAARNSYISFWMTGLGTVAPSMTDGTQPTGPPFPTPVLPLNVTLGAAPIPMANAYVGLVYSGVAQINIQIPANAPSGGAVPLGVTIGSGSSRTDVTIAIQ